MFGLCDSLVNQECCAIKMINALYMVHGLIMFKGRIPNAVKSDPAPAHATLRTVELLIVIQ